MSVLKSSGLYGFTGAAIVLFSLVINVVMLTGPIYMLQIYDRVLASGSVPTLIAISALALLVYALYGVLEFIRSRIMARAAHSIDCELRERAFRAISFHALKGSRTVRSQPFADLATIRQFVAGNGPSAFLDAPWTPIYLCFIYLLHPWLGAAALVVGLVLVAVAWLNNRFIRSAVSSANSLNSRAGAAGEEFCRNAEVTAALGMLPDVMRRWASVHDDSLALYRNSADRSGALSSLSRTLRLVAQSGILGLGAFLAIRQEISAGSMIAASILMARALAPVDLMIANWQGWLSFLEAKRRLSGVFGDMPASGSGFELPRPEGRLCVEKVAFQAPGRVEPLVSGISFNLEKGDGLGIIGPTGSGKTTLARLLVGVAKPAVGCVRLDGAELAQYDADVLGAYVGYMPQDVVLYSGTVGENIARLRANADSTEIVEAARMANAHDLITGLPQGYDTHIQENGANLSAGQRQRIGLARAFFGNPSLVVLDEPNANLDGEGEAAIIDAIRQMRKRGTTVVVIAHRPSAVAALDRLLVLKDGRMAALGPSDEILRPLVHGGPRIAATSPVHGPVHGPVTGQTQVVTKLGTRAPGMQTSEAVE